MTGVMEAARPAPKLPRLQKRRRFRCMLPGRFARHVTRGHWARFEGSPWHVSMHHCVYCLKITDVFAEKR
jgi:hypothetical protein